MYVVFYILAALFGLFLLFGGPTMLPISTSVSVAILVGAALLALFYGRILQLLSDIRDASTKAES